MDSVDSFLIRRRRWLRSEAGAFECASPLDGGSVRPARGGSPAWQTPQARPEDGRIGTHHRAFEKSMPEMIKHSRHTASVPQQRSRWLLGGGDALLLTPTTDHTHTKPPPTLFLALSRALRCLGAKGTAMSFRSVNDSANGSFW